MSKGSSKDDKNTDFAAALQAWETEHPEAWEKAKSTPAKPKKSAEGPMAAQLKARRDQQQAADDAAAQRAAQAHDRTAGPRSKAARQVTEKDLMREAFDALDVDNYDPTSKFRGKGYADAMDVEIIDEAPENAPDEGALPSRSTSEGVKQSYTGADQAFEELMADGGVTPLEDSLDKVRDGISERPTWTREQRAEQAAWQEAIGEDQLNAPTLTKAQRKLLKRAKKAGRIPELNLRHYRKHEAMDQLVNFVRAQQVQGTRFVRIITGKGKRSKTHVVIKPAVLQWCAAPRNAHMLIDYTPSPDESGNYGVVVMELRRPA